MARVWWSVGTLPWSQRMNAIAGPRSRCPSRYRKSLTSSPEVSRYQSSAAWNRVVPSTTCPSRSISAGRTHRPLGTVDPLPAGPEVQRQRHPLRQRRVLRHAMDHPRREPAGIPQRHDVAARMRHDRAARAVRQPVEVLAGGGLEGGASETGAGAAADHQARRARPPAAQHQHLRRPVGNHETKVGAETARPRSRSGFSNSSHARPPTFISGFLDRPGCSPGKAPVSLCSERCGSCLASSLGGWAGLSVFITIAPSLNDLGDQHQSCH